MLYFDDFNVGFSESAGDYLVTEEEMLSFAGQWDPQPIHLDPEAAREAGFRAMTASGCHTFCINSLLAGRLSYFALIGAVEVRFTIPRPTYAGDRLTLTRTCTHKRLSTSKPDRGLATFETRMVNQTGATAMVENSILMLFKHSSQG